MTSRAAIAAVALLATVAPVRRASAESDADTIDRIERELGDARKRLTLVHQYAEKGDVQPLERANQRFSEAETQFLLENYEGCAALLLDVVDMPEFRASKNYAQALYYLGESYYQEGATYIESLRYFRLAIQKLPLGKLYQDSIIRLIDLSDRTGDFQGIDQYFDAVQKAGTARPEVTYLYAKWLAHRKDLGSDVRTQRSDEEFARIQPGQPYYAQSLFFRGALRVFQVQMLQAQIAELQKREKAEQHPEIQEQLQKQIAAKLEEAAGFNQQILALAPPTKADPMFRKAKNLANLALARIYYEQGKLAEATDRYNEVSRDSEDYDDALFETAATYVKMGNYEQALRTSDILLIIGKDSPVAPEAKVLQANLQLKLGQYEKASGTFSDVVSTYGQDYDQVKALVTQPDPIAYFEELLRRRGVGNIAELLPKRVRPFLKLDKQVRDAEIIGNELGLGKKGIEESQALAKKLIDTLAAGKLNLFPQLQEGNSLAIEQSNRLAGLEGDLVKLQMKLLGDDLPEDVRGGLRQLEEERGKLDEKFKNLPKTQEQYEERKGNFLKRIGELDRLAFSLANKVSELRANLVGLQLYWKSTQGTRRVTPAQEAERQAEFDQYTQLIDQLDEERLKIVKQVETERATVAGQATGGQLEEDLRAKYRQQLATMQTLISKALPQVRMENKPLLARIQQARQEVESQQTELAGLRAKMRTKAQDKSEDYRKQVIEQQAILDGYQREVDSVGGRTTHLLGEIAYDSFNRVSRQVYDIVLKADVGLVDIAWTRKKEKSDRIAGLGKDKDEEIRRLQERFKEVLNDAD